MRRMVNLVGKMGGNAKPLASLVVLILVAVGCVEELGTPPNQARCVPEGETIKPGEAGECCEGLSPIPLNQPDQTGACPQQTQTKIFVCTSCGDNRCGEGENRCNCPQDCGKPVKIEDEKACSSDSDCGCGVHKRTGKCFYGNKKFVDTSKQCPDFCSGVGGNLEIRCLAGRCEQVQKNGEAHLFYRVSGCEERYNRRYRGVGLENSRVEITTKNGFLQLVHHLNYVCCAKIVVDWSLLDGPPPILRVVERNLGEVCRCVCSYRVEVSIGPLEEGEHLLQLWGVEFGEKPPSLLWEERVEIGTSPEARPKGFCGWSTNGGCSQDEDCVLGGCSGQVCQSIHEKPVVTTCEWRECYNPGRYGVRCGCVGNGCRWVEDHKVSANPKDEKQPE